jgi:hypothetical protein
MFARCIHPLLHCYCCRPSTFFRVPVAHAFLNGLVRGFWRMACRDTKKNCKLSKGQEAIGSKAAQEMIAANVQNACAPHRSLIRRSRTSSSAHQVLTNLITCMSCIISINEYTGHRSNMRQQWSCAVFPVVKLHRFHMLIKHDMISTTSSLPSLSS